MRTLKTPRSTILDYNGEMFKLLAVHKDQGYDKEKLGYLVKYYGGDKILKRENQLLICEQIEEAKIE
jgi:hypothetical protein